MLPIWNKLKLQNRSLTGGSRNHWFRLAGLPAFIWFLPSTAFAAVEDGSRQQYVFLLYMLPAVALTGVLAGTYFRWRQSRYREPVFARSYMLIAFAGSVPLGLLLVWFLLMRNQNVVALLDLENAGAHLLNMYAAAFFLAIQLVYMTGACSVLELLFAENRSTR